MVNIIKIALRNLLRYKRRTLLTSMLITVGVLAVILFSSITGAFKSLMIGQITDSMLGHLQVHKRGYVASIDNLPLHLNLGPKDVEKIEKVLGSLDGVEAFSPRIKFGGMFSNFEETTNVRLNGIDPAKEVLAAPLLSGRFLKGQAGDTLVAHGEILVPELLAKGMKVKLGDTVVIVATNSDGSVNAATFTVRGVLDAITGPGGRDGYIHIDDAAALLRITKKEANEYAIRLKNTDTLDETTAALAAALSGELNKKGMPKYEIHTWKKLSPFSNIAKMIDVMTFFIRLMLISIVLVSVMNVMIMAVFERVKEIGTIAAIGTRPGKILSLFLVEGLSLGILGSLTGTLVSLAAIVMLKINPISYDFGRQKGLLLSPSVDMGEIIVVFLLVVLISVLASLQPAWKASRMEPVEAMRHV
ncbi:MAG: ABC transporter permease [Candidatus Krumholzibacteria bacterium]|nr:ABC transporter permease [Candidatus Krumholzibacteria bacterium]